MATLDDFLLQDLTDDVLAAHIMTLRAAALRAEYKNTETITATKQLTDNDTPFQLITASGANRDVKLAAEATTNHATVIYNNGASNNVVVKDDSGAITFATLAPEEFCFAIPMGGVAWKTVNLNSASTSSSGIVELATAAETTTGTDATRAVTPDSLAGSDFGKVIVSLEVTGPSVLVTTGDGKKYFWVPSELNGYNLVGAYAAVATVSSSGTPTIQVRNVTDSVDMLSTRITIDANEKTSYTAAAPAAIDTTHDDIATGDQIAIDVDVAGTSTAGLTVLLIFQLP